MTGTSKKTVQENGEGGGKLLVLVTEAREESQLSEEIGVRRPRGLKTQLIWRRMGRRKPLGRRGIACHREYLPASPHRMSSISLTL